jgi:hypothetical protein
MEPLLFTDENAPEWAFSKRKGVSFAKSPTVVPLIALLVALEPGFFAL